MKKSIILFAAVLLTAAAFTQSPQKMSYQSVIRNASNDLVNETLVGIQISILQGSASGTAVYVETHATMTNINGLVSLELGMGIPVTGTFADIDWGSGPYFIKTETDPDGGTSYTLSGVNELLAVPFALFANEAATEPFSTSGNVTSNTLGNFATDDFIFGSPALDDDDISDHEARLFFDKSKGAFRAGRTFNDEWDDQNVGSRSTAMGNNTTASGQFSTALGFTSLASGVASTAMGANSTASGSFSTAMGNNTTAPSYAETVIGRNNTSYTPQSDLIWDLQDRLFVIGNGNFSQSNAMVILKNGNTGLGTSIPNETLEIGGNGRAFFGDGQGDDRKGLLIDGVQGENAARIEAFDYGTGTGLDLVLNTSTSGGNVGIRTNAPTATLSVNGSANKTGGGSWAVFSDRRLKKDISSYEDGLKTVMDIDPVKFKYNGISKVDTIKEYVGVIAQEIDKVSPYMVNSIEINGTEYLEVDNSAMTYMLINAVKEQQEIISEQHERIECLETELSKKKSNYVALYKHLESQQELINLNTQLLQELNGILKTQSKR